MSVTEVSRLIADKALVDWGEDIAKPTLFRAAKAAALATKTEQPGPHDDFGLGLIDFNADPTTQGEGYSSFLLAPRVYKDAPELFWGPFLQIGSYLKDSGVIDSAGTALALDLALDPLNLVSFGAGGLTAAGKAGRVLGWLSEGGKITEGAKVVEKAAAIMESAGKAAKVSPEVFAAAKAGDKAAVSRVLKLALESGDLADDYKPVVEALRRDKRTFAKVLENADAIAEKTLRPGDVLQDTLRGRIAAKQVRGVGIGVVIPDSPFKHPLTFSRQMLGFSHAGDRFFFPVSDIAAGGLEKVAPDFFSVKGAAEIVPEMSLQGPLAEADELRRAFRASTGREARIKPWQASVATEALIAATSAPNTKLFSAMGYADLDPDLIEQGYRKLYQVKKEQKVAPEALTAFSEDLLADINGTRAAVDSAAMDTQSAVIDRMLGRIEDAHGQALRAGEIDAGAVDAAKAQARRIFNTLRRTETLRYESHGLGSALAARSNLGTLLAHIANANHADIVRGAYKGSAVRESVREVIGYAIGHPDLFEERGGRLFLKSADVDEAAPFLGKLLKDSKAGKAAFLEEHLLKEGLDPDVTAIVRQMSDALDGAGRNLLAEGVLSGLISDYFPRVFKPSDKFLKTHKLLRSDVPGFVERMVSGETQEKKLEALLFGDATRGLMEKSRQKALSMQESRRLVEQMALDLERRGYGRYERDGLAVYSSYMDSANRALLWNRIALNPTALAPALTQSAILSELGGDAAKYVSEEYLRAHKIHRVMEWEKVPEKLRDTVFLKVTGRPRAPGAESAKALTEIAIGKQAQAGSRAAAAASLKGRQKIGGYKLVSKSTGQPIAFDPGWALSGRYPEDLRAWKEIKVKVDAMLDKAGTRASKLSEEFVERGIETAGKPVQGTLGVFRPDFGHLQDAFGLMKQGRMNNAFLRLMDRWNFRVKSVVLAGDIFHYNVLALSQFALNPLDSLRYLVDDAGHLLPGVRDGGFAAVPSVRNAALGAATGAGVAVASGRDDLGDIATYSLAGAVYGAAIAAAGKNARKGFNLLVSPDHLDTLRWMGLGGWNGRPDDRAIGALQLGLKTLEESLLRDGKTRFLTSPITGARHLSDIWDRQLWDVLQNGSKHHYFATRWARELPKLEASVAFKAGDEAARHLAKVDLAKQLVQAGNNAFGGQTWRYLLDRPEMQHGLRMAFLSPDWTLSRLEGGANIFMNLRTPGRLALGAALGTATDYVQYGGDISEGQGRGPVFGALMGAGLGAFAQGVARRMTSRGDVLARESRRLWGAALGLGMLAMNGMNYALTGRFMWDNPEGKRTSIDLGDGTYVSLGKPWVEPLEFAGIYHPDRYPIPIVSRAVSKGASLPVAGLRILSNDDGFGPLIVGKDSPVGVAYKLVDFTVDLATPIAVQGPLRLAREVAGDRADAGSVERALLRGGGFTTTTIPRRGGGTPALNYANPLIPSLGASRDSFGVRF